MRPNRVFFPQDTLDQWIADGRADLRGSELFHEGRRFLLEEAVHVVRDVAGGGDTANVLGRVKTRGQLDQLGAEMLERSLIVGDDAYDVVPGFAGELVQSTASATGSRPAVAAVRAEANDEELLAEFLLKSL